MRRRHSQMDPYRSAIYLQSLIRAIEYIADHPDMDRENPSLAGLLTIANERAEQLAEDLDHPDFFAAHRPVGASAPE